MPKILYNPLSNKFDYVSKNADFAISGSKDYSEATDGRFDGDKLMWDVALGKWIPYNEWIDAGESNTSYYFYIDADTGTFIFDGGSA